MSVGHGRIRVASCAFPALLALSSCGADRDAARTIALEECRLPHLATAARCGVVTVPEDREKPDGRTIGIHVAVLAANTLTPKPDPLVILAGGPGQAASEIAPFAARLLEIRRTRDVVLVDQRGTGRSSPLLCAAYSEAGLKDAMLETDPMPRAKACAGELAAQGIDASRYTTAAFVEDLESVRVALGAPHWNLWGGSYGTRVALDYLRRHPERTRTVTLDGVAPPDMIITLDVWTSRESALDSLFARCDATPSCGQASPDLAGTLDAIGRTLGTRPREIAITDPATGVSRLVPASIDTVIGLLQPLLYVPETVALIPALLERARDGDLAPLVATASALTGDLDRQMNIPLHYAVTCAEDVPRVGLGLREQSLAGKRSARLARRTLAICDVWPQGHAPIDAFAPVSSDVPVLILSGGLDPVTPPANGEAVARSLTNHRHVIARGYGHIVSPHACAPRLLAAFVAEAGFATLPEDCVKQLESSTPPALWTGLLGPAMP
ncbi:MAG: alpha/beta fold hydrolase [Betaproteobacteria bacterium]